MPDIQGKLEIQDTGGSDTRIELDGDSGSVEAGGNGKRGTLTLNDPNGQERIRVGRITELGGGVGPTPEVVADYWGLEIRGAAGDLVRIGRHRTAPTAPQTGSVPTVSTIVGGGGYRGLLQLDDDSGSARARLGKVSTASDDWELTLYNDDQSNLARIGSDPRIELRRDNKPAVRIEGNGANVYLGGHDQDGDLVLFPNEGDNATLDQATFHANGSNGEIQLKETGHLRVSLNPQWAQLRMGGNGVAGHVVLQPETADNLLSAESWTVWLDGDGGRLHLRAPEGDDRVYLDGPNANLWLGGKGADGDVVLFASKERNNRDASKATIHLNGDAGDIILRNADCAEDFTVAAAGTGEPGTVMVIGEAGDLEPCAQPYDHRVAGIVSGAGALRPGIVLGRDPGRPEDVTATIALAGRAMCRVDASFAPIRTGDLLTTCATPGHAMRATNPERAFGTILGKAMEPIEEGQGLIPVLVALG